MVGCVIVHRGQIIGEGFHQKYGEAHAEVNAINSVQDKSLLSESTLYVNLEPCSHFGKTPPCADLIIKHQLKRVVVANADINPLVAGKGFQKLRNAGIEVQCSVLQEEGASLNKRFFTAMKQLRPYIILKWAETADGFMARADGQAQWFSNELARKLVHKWRSEEDAVMVASRTALIDNPRLTIREWTPLRAERPVRVVVDRKLSLPNHLHLFDRSLPTLCYNLHSNQQSENLELIKLPEESFLESMMHSLHYRCIQSVLVEGGAQLFQAMLQADLWDEIRVFRCPMSIGQGVAAPRCRGRLIAREQLLDNQLDIYRRE
jgi:diaminohydroxyphosphoribosylaminopyrimidine deaminase/5-amino-6-(5-phosphoribosylamino)uracil reductase